MGRKRKSREQELQDWKNQQLIKQMEEADSSTEDRHPSGKWEQAGQDYTVNSTDDPKAPGGYYVSIKDKDTGDHATAVYNNDDTFAETKANEGWRDS